MINQKINLNLTEDLIKAKESAEVANKAKSLFLANISHELRTPMHGILSFASIASSKLDEVSKEDLKEYLFEILDSGQRLMGLLNDLLDLAKLESGKMTYDFSENDIHTSIDAAVSALSNLAKAKKNTLEIDCPDELVGQFDKERITQVLINLISNAIKFSHPNTPIKISAHRRGKFIHIQVENNGVGIDPAELEHIFEKFIQSKNTRKKSGGTGLGLAICREIVLAHEGKIWAESNPSKSTRFQFEIPIVLSESDAK